MTIYELIEHLLTRLREVQARLGLDATASAGSTFVDVVDSMGLVEFVGVVAADCGVRPEEIEQAVQRRFTTIANLAAAMHAVRLLPRSTTRQTTFAFADKTEGNVPPAAWLAEWRVGPMDSEPTEDLDPRLDRPQGWLKQHAGIHSRWYWVEKDWAEQSATFAANACLQRLPARHRHQTLPRTLLVTGESAPRPLGQAAALHHRLGFPPDVTALDVGGACVGLLNCLWLAQRLVRPREHVLIVAIESHTTWLSLRAGPEGEAAALFGDGAGACLLTADALPGALPLLDVRLGCDGSAGSLVEVRLDAPLPPVIRMDGPALALRAIEKLSEVVCEICEGNGVRVEDLEAVYVHAGNGRMPPLVARKLSLPDDRVVSTTAFSGNLGSVSLLAALSHRPPAGGPVVLAAVGAGLCWGAALLGAPAAG
jgi:3-oxoacyl-[acyl-carrier-protein] synthase III